MYMAYIIAGVSLWCRVCYGCYRMFRSLYFIYIKSYTMEVCINFMSWKQHLLLTAVGCSLVHKLSMWQTPISYTLLLYFLLLKRPTQKLSIFHLVPQKFLCSVATENTRHIAPPMYHLYVVVYYSCRTQFRSQMNQADNKAGAQAIDSLINYETVKV